jgi:hypothetical protein
MQTYAVLCFSGVLPQALQLPAVASCITKSAMSSDQGDVHGHSGTSVPPDVRLPSFPIHCPLLHVAMQCEGSGQHVDVPSLPNQDSEAHKSG